MCANLLDIKNFVRNKCMELNDPVCTCFLQIFRWADNRKYITPCYEYNDNTFLKNTIFDNNKNPIKVCFKKKNCTCGQYEKLKILSEFDKKSKEKEKKWEERERQNKQYYENIIQNQKVQQQQEVNRLYNLIDKQRQDNNIQINNQKKEQQAEVNRLQCLINKQREDNNIQIKNIELNHKNEINRLQEEKKLERKTNNERFQILEATIKEKNIQIEKNTKQLEENEYKKNQIIKAQNDAEKEYINTNYLIIQNYILNYKDKIIEDFLKEMNELKIIFNELTKENISQITKLEKFSKNVKSIIEDKIDSLNEETIDFKVTHFNILIPGNTGVGKSTLVNKILKSNLAKTDKHKPCTMGKPKSYESETAKGIRMWDSRGIENGKYNLEAANKEVIDTINNLIKDNDPDKFIHCIWYCIHSNRFTNEEMDNLISFYNSYTDKLPIIIVFTIAENPKKTNGMIDYVQKEFNKKKQINIYEEQNDVKFLKVLAKKSKILKENIESYGIHNLMNETCECAKIGIERACIQSLMKQGEKMLKEEFREIIDNFKKKYEKNSANNNYNLNTFINEIKTFSQEIVRSLLYNENLSEKTKETIVKLMSDQSDIIKKYFEKIFKEKLDSLSNQLSENLVDFVSKLDIKYNITYLSSKYNYNELKRKAKEEIERKLKPIIEAKIYSEMSKKLLEKFGTDFSAKLLEIFQGLLVNNKKIREIFNEKGKSSSISCFNKIKSMMDYPKDDLVENKEDESDEDDD